MNRELFDEDGQLRIADLLADGWLPVGALKVESTR